MGPALRALFVLLYRPGEELSILFFYRSMPNLDPAPDTLERLQIQLDAIARDAAVTVRPYGTITRGEAGEVLASFPGLWGRPCGRYSFYYTGRERNCQSCFFTGSVQTQS